MDYVELTDAMDLTEKLGVWGRAQAAANAAHARAQAPGAHDPELGREAQRLREHAHRLHRQIYDEIGRRPASR